MLVRMWSNQNSHIFLVEMQNYAATLKKQVVSYKIKCTPTIWPINPNPVCPKEIKTDLHYTCMQMFTEAFLIITPRCKTTHMFYNLRMDKETVVLSYNSILFCNKKDELVICKMAWMNLYCFVSHESNRTQTSYCIISCKWHSKAGKIVETENWWLTGLQTEGRVWLQGGIMRELFRGEGNVPYPDCGGGYLSLGIFQNTTVP